MPDRLTPPELDLEPSAAALLDAVIAMSSDLDLHGVLLRIVRSAIDLTNARYGALGILGADGTFDDFITIGIEPELEALIGDHPSGRGILGALIDHPVPLRLSDLGQDPRAFGLPPHHPPMKTFLGVPVRIRGTVYGNLYLTEKYDGGDFTREDEVLVETLATAAGYVIENARAYGLSEIRRVWLEASTELTNQLQPPIEYVDAVARLVAVTQRLTRAVGVAFLSRSSEEPVVAIAATGGSEREDIVSKAALAVMATAPERLNRLIEVKAHGLHGVAVPVAAQLAGRGALVIFERNDAPITAEVRELLASFAEQAALALDRAQAIDDRSALAVLSDRERIARDLHDIVIQRLFATGLQLQSLRLQREDDEITPRLDTAIDALDQTVRDIRSTIFELRNRRTDSLRAEVRDLIREYIEPLGFAPTVNLHGPVDTSVSEKVREHLVSVLREAVSNLARHALADSADIDLTVTDKEVRLSVLDDGVGPRVGAVESGLRNARRRASELGGSFELTQRTPRGTSFVWTVPL